MSTFISVLYCIGIQCNSSRHVVELSYFFMFSTILLPCSVLIVVDLVLVLVVILVGHFYSIDVRLLGRSLVFHKLFLKGIS